MTSEPTTKTRNKTPIEIAVRATGGQSELARRLGIKPQSVQGWVASGRVPAARVLDVERASGIPRHVIRPDIYPPDDYQAT